jgi:hypothetical protein
MKLFKYELEKMWKKASYNIFGYHSPLLRIAGHPPEPKPRNS